MKVTLIESEDIGLIGVGEATIPPIRAALSFLGIDEQQFVAATSGSYKLGIEFVNWLRLGHSYLHPFGAYGIDWGGIPFHQHFLRYQKNGGTAEYQAFSLTASAAKAGKFASTTLSEQLSRNWNYAFHFDSTLAAPFFREYAERLGVERVEGRVDAASTDENGYITEAMLADGMTKGSVDRDALIRVCLDGIWKVVGQQPQSKQLRDDRGESSLSSSQQYVCWPSPENLAEPDAEAMPAGTDSRLIPSVGRWGSWRLPGAPELCCREAPMTQWRQC